MALLMAIVSATNFCSSTVLEQRELHPSLVVRFCTHANGIPTVDLPAFFNRQHHFPIFCLSLADANFFAFPLSLIFKIENMMPGHWCVVGCCYCNFII
jgi:hypothetical protein